MTSASPRRARARGALIAGCCAAGLALACAGSSARFHALEARWQDAAEPSPASAGEDPFAGSTALDREALVAEVLRRNPGIRSARQAWRAALARYPQQTSLDDPMLGVGVGPRSFGSSRIDPAYRVDLSQKFPFPGKLGLRGEVALGEAEAAAGDYEAVRLRLAAVASLVFDDYYVAARALEINAEHVQLVGELERVATARYEAGTGSQQDPLQAEVTLAELMQREVVLRADQRVASEQLALLLHRRADLPLPPPPRDLALPQEVPLAQDELIASALRQRPELRAAAARVRAREAGVGLARREFLPDFSLLGAQNAVMQDEDLQPFVGISINVPLRIARRRAALDEAQARLEGARRDRESLEDEVRFSVSSGAERLAEAQSVLDLVRDRLLPAARDQLAAARAGFESGRNDFSTLIEAERNLRSVQLGYEEARADVSRRHAELARATGTLPVAAP